MTGVFGKESVDTKFTRMKGVLKTFLKNSKSRPRTGPNLDLPLQDQVIRNMFLEAAAADNFANTLRQTFTRVRMPGNKLLRKSEI